MISLTQLAIFIIHLSWTTYLLLASQVFERLNSVIYVLSAALFSLHYVGKTLIILHPKPPKIPAALNDQLFAYDMTTPGTFLIPSRLFSSSSSHNKLTDNK